MKEIPRDHYLNRLIEREFDGLVKIVTGIRRCGKSYLLFKLFKDHLIASGVPADHILAIDLENYNNKNLRDSDKLFKYVEAYLSDKTGRSYILIDEIQNVNNFTDLVNGLRHLPETDIYITGSNSKFLSSDIITEFRGRSEEIRVRPLSFSEYFSVCECPLQQAWDEYLRYGGMPETVGYSPQHKEEYLLSLVKSVYLLDITERFDIRNPNVLESLMSALCSAVGSLTNISKITNTIATLSDRNIDNKTVAKYLDLLCDSFLFEKAQRYDVKGRKYFESICKYYVADIGLRNSWLGYRQQEPTHLMENIIYNELRTRGYSVDVGIVPVRTKKGGNDEYTQLEIDFIANKGNDRVYIQSAYSVSDKDKHESEVRPFLKVNDSFKKIMIVDGNEIPWKDENGIITVGITRFLLDMSIME